MNARDRFNARRHRLAGTVDALRTIACTCRGAWTRHAKRCPVYRLAVARAGLEELTRRTSLRMHRTDPTVGTWVRTDDGGWVVDLGDAAAVDRIEAPTPARPLTYRERVRQQYDPDWTPPQPDPAWVDDFAAQVRAIIGPDLRVVDGGAGRPQDGHGPVRGSDHPHQGVHGPQERTGTA